MQGEVLITWKYDSCVEIIFKQLERVTLQILHNYLVIHYLLNPKQVKSTLEKQHPIR